jgi:hypothetical protein
VIQHLGARTPPMGRQPPKPTRTCQMHSEEGLPPPPSVPPPHLLPPWTHLGLRRLLSAPVIDGGDGPANLDPGALCSTPWCHPHHFLSMANAQQGVGEERRFPHTQPLPTQAHRLA